MVQKRSSKSRGNAKRARLNSSSVLPLLEFAGTQLYKRFKGRNGRAIAAGTSTNTKGKFKSYNSYTKTKTNPKSKIILPSGFNAVGATGTIRQVIRMGGKKPRSTNIIYDHHYQQIMETTNGSQFAGSGNLIMGNPANDFGTTQVYNASRTNATQYGTNLFQLTPRYKGIATGLYPNDFDIAINNECLWLNKITSVHNLTNFTNAPIEVQILWCAPVKNCLVTPLNAWADAIGDSQNSQNVASYASLAATTSVAPGHLGSIDGIYVHGQDPAQYKEFKKSWNIKKRNKIKLSAGQTYDVATSIIYNKKIEVNILSDITSDYITGLTLVPLFIIRSSPVIVFDSVAPLNQEVSYGEAKLGIIHHQKLHMSMMLNKRINTHRIHYGLLRDYTTTANVTSRIINEEGNLDTVQEVGDVDNT